jgi:putative ABC transport system permease protein
MSDPSLQLHRFLLRVLPEPLHAEHGREMEETFRSMLRDARASGRIEVLRLWVRELRHLLAVASAARLRRDAWRAPSPSLPHTSSRAELMNDLRQDLRFAFRVLIKERTAAASIVLILALGIGANTAVFAVVDAALLRPLPYPEADRLVLVWAQRAASDDPTTTVSPAAFLEWRERARSFTDLAAQNLMFPVIQTGDGSERVLAGIVTPSYFGLMGVTPALGRDFRPEDAQAGVGDVVVLGHGLWVRSFAGDPGVLGREIRIDGRARTIVGVMPAGYRHPDPHRPLDEAQLWLPVAFDRANAGTGGFLRVFGRLRPGVTVDAAEREMRDIARSLRGADPVTHWSDGAMVVPLRDWFFTSVRPALIVVMAAAALVLLIVCANIANLVMVRGQRRRREFAVRTALGANRGRLARLLLVESLLLTSLGALVGLGVLAITRGGLEAVAGSAVSNLAVIRVDARVLLFMALLTAATAASFGLLPLRDVARWDVRAVLAEEGGRGSGGGAAQRLRSTLVVAEVALAVVLVVAAGLLARSVAMLGAVPPGFEAREGVMIDLVLPQAGYSAPGSVVAFVRRVEAELEALPGIEAVGTVDDPPIVGGDHSRSFDLPARPFPETDLPSVDYRQVTPGYFDALGIVAVRGRLLTDADARGVTLVSETAASRFWNDREVVGQTVVVGGDTLAVVGVTADIPDDGYRRPPDPEVTLPFAPRPSRALTLIVRAGLEAEAAAAAAAARSTVSRLDPNVAVGTVRTLADVISAPMRTERTAARLAGLFSALATLLAGMGVYGVLAYAVSARTREIGIRTAMGARTGDVVGLVLGDSLRLGVAGVALGALLALPATRVLGSLLFGVGSADPVSFLGAGVTMLMVSLVATWLPARRAARVSPVDALRRD